VVNSFEPPDPKIVILSNHHTGATNLLLAPVFVMLNFKLPPWILVKDPASILALKLEVLVKSVVGTPEKVVS
jgi:hypothetical protein